MSLCILVHILPLSEREIHKEWVLRYVSVFYHFKTQYHKFSGLNQYPFINSYSRCQKSGLARQVSLLRLIPRSRCQLHSASCSLKEKLQFSCWLVSGDDSIPEAISVPCWQAPSILHSTLSGFIFSSQLKKSLCFQGIHALG